MNLALFESGTLSLSSLIQEPVLKTYIHSHNSDAYRQTDVPHNNLRPSSSSPQPGLTSYNQFSDPLFTTGETGATLHQVKYFCSIR